MHLLLIGPRGDGEREQATRRTAAALARGLLAAGERVSWLGPPGEAALLGDPRIGILAAESRPPAFRSVEAQLVDIPRERALGAALRREPPDLVLVFGFGGANSYLLPWLSDRLGVPPIVVASPIAPVLCHRGSLIDREGAACSEWRDAERCADCCRGRSAAGLGALQAGLATLCRPLRGLSPFPHRTAFLNRLDMIAQGLVSARLVLVDDEPACAALIELGVPERLLRVGVPRDVGAWRELARGLL